MPSFDIPEFIPGQPWQGASLPKIEDDPNITPGSVARTITGSTSALNTAGMLISRLLNLFSIVPQSVCKLSPLPL